MKKYILKVVGENLWHREQSIIGPLTTNYPELAERFNSRLDALCSSVYRQSMKNYEVQEINEDLER